MGGRRGSREKCGERRGAAGGQLLQRGQARRPLRGLWGPPCELRGSFIHPLVRSFTHALSFSLLPTPPLPSLLGIHSDEWNACTELGRGRREERGQLRAGAAGKCGPACPWLRRTSAGRGPLSRPPPPRRPLPRPPVTRARASPFRQGSAPVAFRARREENP